MKFSLPQILEQANILRRMKAIRLRLTRTWFRKITAGEKLFSSLQEKLRRPAPIPAFRVPDIHFPALRLPSVRLPSFRLPAFRLPVLRTPDAFTKPIPHRYLEAALVVLLAIVPVIAVLNFTLSTPAHTYEIASKSAPVLVQSNQDLLVPDLAEIEPASGLEEEIAEVEKAIDADDGYKYTPEIDTLEVETVLVPRQVTVISSSRDGRIAEMPFYAGDTFSKGDILVRYDCRDLEAEAEIAHSEKALTKKKVQSGYMLFNLELISDVENLGFVTEYLQSDARQKLYVARLELCRIRAEFDGRVTNRLANPGEYTRTDRVLMEVASTGPMLTEFLIPSKWLRWVNVGAPLNIAIGETGETYPAEIVRIYGEVDPVSQSIQVTARLNKKTATPLLPGMSGQAMLDVQSIRAAGIRGFLEPKIARAE